MDFIYGILLGAAVSGLFFYFKGERDGLGDHDRVEANTQSEVIETFDQVCRESVNGLDPEPDLDGLGYSDEEKRLILNHIEELYETAKKMSYDDMRRTAEELVAKFGDRMPAINIPFERSNQEHFEETIESLIRIHAALTHLACLSHHKVRVADVEVWIDEYSEF